MLEPDVIKVACPVLRGGLRPVTASGYSAMAFLKKVKHACKGKLPRIFIDWGSWYPWALERAGFERHTVISFGPRSAIERLFGDIEKRIRQFWNGFIGTYTREGMQQWGGSIYWIQK